MKDKIQDELTQALKDLTEEPALYSVVPAEILIDNSLSHLECRIYCILLGYTRSSGCFFASMDTLLSRFSWLHKTSWKRTLISLEKKRLIWRKRIPLRGKGCMRKIVPFHHKNFYLKHLLGKGKVKEAAEMESFFTAISPEVLENKYSSKKIHDVPKVGDEGVILSPSYESHDLCPSFIGEENTLEKKDTTPTSTSCVGADGCASKLAGVLLSSIKSSNPKMKPPKLKAWEATLDRMLRLDRRDLLEAISLAEWIPYSEFWSKTCLSAESFRRNYDKLWASMERDHASRARERKPSPPNSAAPPLPLERENREWIARYSKEMEGKIPEHIKIVLVKDGVEIDDSRKMYPKLYLYADPGMRRSVQEHVEKEIADER